MCDEHKSILSQKPSPGLTNKKMEANAESTSVVLRVRPCGGVGLKKRRVPRLTLNARLSLRV